MREYFRARLRGFGLQQMSMSELALDIENTAELFMPTSPDETAQWQAEVNAATADYALGDSPFREFGLTHADALASRQTIHDALTGAAHHEVACRFEGWRVVVVGVDPLHGLRLLQLNPLSDDH